jgi:hypothetical protein
VAFDPEINENFKCGPVRLLYLIFIMVPPKPYVRIVAHRADELKRQPSVTTTVSLEGIQ